MRILLLLFLAVVACRKNPECFGTSECPPGTVCFKEACVDPSEADAGVATWWGEIEPIVATRCQQCHTNPPSNGAPFPLVDYQDTLLEVSGQRVYDRMAARVASTGSPMPPAPSAPLSARDQSLFDAWARSGAAEGPPPFAWNTDVLPIVQASCLGCHSDPPRNGAPMPLVSYDQTQIPSRSGRPVYEAMGLRVVDSVTPMPPMGALDPTSIRTIRVWAATGAPETPQTTGNLARYDGGVPVGQDPRVGIGAATQIASGYQSIQGLAWDSVLGVLYFSDAGQGTIYRLTPPTIVDTLRTDGEGPFGVAVDNQGRVVAGEQASREVTRTTPMGAVEVLADRYRQNRLNSPAAVFARISDGTIYFSDPAFGIGTNIRELPYNGLYRVGTDGVVRLEWSGGEGTGPAGITLSPDESILYLSDRVDRVIRAFDVGGGGALENERIFAFTDQSPQGITVDVTGNLYVAVASGVAIYAPSGAPWGIIPTPAPPTAVAFGGPTLETLYVATGSVLYSIDVVVAGTAWGRVGPQPDAGFVDGRPSGHRHPGRRAPGRRHGSDPGCGRLHAPRRWLRLSGRPRLDGRRAGVPLL